MVKAGALRGHVALLSAAVVAGSGGADSAHLARVAHDVCGARGVAVAAESPSHPRRCRATLFRAILYHLVTLDMQGCRAGSLHEGLLLRQA